MSDDWCRECGAPSGVHNASCSVSIKARNDQVERLRHALDELVSHVEADGEHSPRQRDEHYEDDCPICNALTEAVAALADPPA